MKCKFIFRYLKRYTFIQNSLMHKLTNYLALKIQFSNLACDKIKDSLARKKGQQIYI